MIKLLQTLRNHKLHVSIGTIIIVIASFVMFIVASTMASDTILHDSQDLYMLGSTIYCEVGPDFRQSLQSHIDTLIDYKKYLSERRFSFLISSKYNPVDEIDAALKILKGTKESKIDQESVAKKIWEAGDLLMTFHNKAIGSPQVRLSFDENPEPVEQLITDTYNAIRDANEAVDILDSTIEKAELMPDTIAEKQILLRAFNGCNANRNVMRRLFLARKLLLTNDGQKLLDQFLESVNKTTKLEERAKKLKLLSNNGKRILSIFNTSEQHRINILNALAENDMQRAYVYQREALRWSIGIKDEVLSLSEEIELTQNRD